MSTFLHLHKQLHGVELIIILETKKTMIINSHYLTKETTITGEEMKVVGINKRTIESLMVK